MSDLTPRDPEKENAEEKKKQDAEASKPHRDNLDEALNGTFPASDPPANAIQGTTSVPTPEEKERALRGA